MSAPSLDNALRLLPQVLNTLTQVSLESVAETLCECPDGDQDAILAEQYHAISKTCAQIQVDASKLNPKWNLTYGAGGTDWSGALKDEHPRGGVPYFCPKGWARFSLRVCEDAEFENKYGNWGYAYHGTRGKFVGSILTSGFKTSNQVLVGTDDRVLFMSPSIEYSGHPRYAGIEYNPETRQWIQVVLQCRVNPKAVAKKTKETLCATTFKIKVDQNFKNKELEWLIKQNYRDPVTGIHYVKDVIVCTGIMMRVTQNHPYDNEYWWVNQNYPIGVPELLRVDPTQSTTCFDNWQVFENAHMTTFTSVGDPLSENYSMTPQVERIGRVLMSPLPFAQGGMRSAFYLHTANGLFVVKDYLPEAQRHIMDGLDISIDDAVDKEVATYLVAEHYARMFNSSIHGWGKGWQVQFVEPYVFHLWTPQGNRKFFGEKYVDGAFIKWNNNAGECNMHADATKGSMHHLAAAFCHYTYVKSKGRAMIVDIQGWDKTTHALFTDPQVHTRAFRGRSKDRRDQFLFRRFSLGNFGRTGMMKFFSSHDCCSGLCGRLDLKNPLHSFDVIVQEDPWGGEVKLKIEGWSLAKKMKKQVCCKLNLDADMYSLQYNNRCLADDTSAQDACIVQDSVVVLAKKDEEVHSRPVNVPRGPNPILLQYNNRCLADDTSAQDACIVKDSEVALAKKDEELHSRPVNVPRGPNPIFKSVWKHAARPLAKS